MALIITGLFLFTVVGHLGLSAAPGAANALRQRIGDIPVKAAVAITSIAGICLIVMGWKSGGATVVYTPDWSLRIPATVLTAIALYLFVVSNRPSRVKRLVRHPQLTGVSLWAIAHLLMNGDSHSVALFTGLGVWALLEIALINKREGLWVKPAAPGAATEVVTLVISLLVIAGVAWAHPWLAGVPILGRY